MTEPRGLWVGPMLILSLAFYGLIGWWAFGQTVTNDNGGPVQERIDQMRGMDGVRIVGDCMSACTLYLGLPDTCVTPSARLGFHSPTSALPGIPLPREDWERVTAQMAAHYPPAIADWFMREARWSERVMLLSGREAIRMGVAECA